MISIERVGHRVKWFSVKGRVPHVSIAIDTKSSLYRWPYTGSSVYYLTLSPTIDLYLLLPIHYVSFSRPKDEASSRS
jgi:hypothetical protein